ELLQEHSFLFPGPSLVNHWFFRSWALLFWIAYPMSNLSSFSAKRHWWLSSRM
ncbi:hypothetical protein KI387_025692, partial [Taxus chinensis]